MELNRDVISELQTIRRKIQGLLWEFNEITGWEDNEIIDAARSFGKGKLDGYYVLPVPPEETGWITIILFGLNEMKDAIDEMENELAEYESERG